MKGRDVPSWDDYFLALAQTVSLRSKDPSTQVGCVIVDAKNHVVSTGYNGPPPGIDDDSLDWSRPAKYDWVIHAELNAILHARSSVSWCKMYVTGRPCSQCAKAIVAAGINVVVYTPMPIAMCDEAEAKKMEQVFWMGRVLLRKLEPRPNSLA